MTSKCDKPNCQHRAVWDIMTGTGARFCSCGHDLHYMLRTIGVQHGRMVAITPCEVTPERTKPDIQPQFIGQDGLVFYAPTAREDATLTLPTEEADNA